MTLSSSRHDVVISDITVTVEQVADASPRTWALSFNGAEAHRVTTEADCVLSGTLPKGKGQVDVTVHQKVDGSVHIGLVHDGEPLVTFNDAPEVE